MEPINYLRAVRRRWRVIVITVLVAGVAAYITTETVAPIDPNPDKSFEATAQLLLAHAEGGQQDSPATSTKFLAVLVTSRTIATRVAEAMNFDGDPMALARQINASADEETGILQIKATAKTANDAEVLANTFKQELLGHLKDERNADLMVLIEDKQAELKAAQKAAKNADEGGSTPTTPTPTGHDTTGTGGGAPAATDVDFLKGEIKSLREQLDDPIAVDFDEDAVAHAVPASNGLQPPNTRAGRVGLGMLLGLFVGVGLALVVERFDSKVRTKDNAEERFGVPVLAEIPKMPRGDRGRIVSATRPASPPAEAFRLLGAGITRLVHRSEHGGNGSGATDKKPMVILVTSAGPSEGKSTVAANLAAVYGEVGRKVLVLSCDLRRPSVHRLFDMEDGPGLTEALASRNGHVLNGCVERTGIENVSIVTSGRAEGKASLLGSDQMRRVLAESRQLADVVIMDTAPILVSSEVAPMIPEVDAVLIVAEAGKTSANLAEHTSELLKRLGASSVGVALNRAAEISVPKGYHKYYVSSRPASKNGSEPDEDVDPVPATPVSQVASTTTPAPDAAGRGDDRAN